MQASQHTPSNGAIYGVRMPISQRWMHWTAVAEPFNLYGATAWKSMSQKIRPVRFCSGKGGPPQVFEREIMQIPSEEECYRLIYEIRMMEHIAAHSVRVCQVALLLTDHLNASGYDLNRDLIRASALLHDITKTRSFETGENHALTGCQFLSGLGYAEVGDIVRQHVRLDVYDASEIPAEAEIVNYADKRVLHDQVASLQQRLAYIMEKYGTRAEYHERIRYTWQKTGELEKKLFSMLPFSPQDVAGLISPQAFSACLSAYRAVCDGKRYI